MTFAAGLDASQAQGSTDIVADPEHQADNGTGSVGFPGARDARPFEAQQPYVQTFTTPVRKPPSDHRLQSVRFGGRHFRTLILEREPNSRRLDMRCSNFNSNHFR